MIAVILFFITAFILVPRFFTERKGLSFIGWSVVILTLAIGAGFLLDRLLLNLYNLPTGPNEISDKMLQYPRRIVYKAPVIPGILMIYSLGILYGISRDWLLKSWRQS